MTLSCGRWAAVPDAGTALWPLPDVQRPADALRTVGHAAQSQAALMERSGTHSTAVFDEFETGVAVSR